VNSFLSITSSWLDTSTSNVKQQYYCNNITTVVKKEVAVVVTVVVTVAVVATVVAEMEGIEEAQLYDWRE